MGVVASFGHLIPDKVINLCRAGFLNVHGSLLPRYRGASPIQQAILNGDPVSGVTIMKIRPEAFDIGDIILQQEIPMHSTATTQEMLPIFAQVGTELLIRCIKDLRTHLDQARSQPSEGVSYARKLKKSFGLLDFTTMTSRDVDRRCRALKGQFDVYAFWQPTGIQVNFHDLHDADEMRKIPVTKLVHKSIPIMADKDPPPGYVFYLKTQKLLAIKCKSDPEYGEWVGFQNVHPKEHRTMSALDFRNGYLNKVDVQKRIVSHNIKILDKDNVG